MERTDFVLSAELFGHASEVRSVIVLENGTLITGSRDLTIRVWLPTGKGTFELHKTLIGHQGAVASFAYVGGSPYFPPGAVIASAGYDKIINIWDLEKDEPLATLIGHEKEVCCLSTLDGRLISGSWDATARVWEGAQCISVLRHTASVVAILGTNTGEIITGTGSNEIKVWKNNAEVATLLGHKNVVRAIVPLEPVGFLTASNDETVRMWSKSGEQLQEIHAMDEFIWALSVLQGPSAGLFVCGGEERYAKVWSTGGELKQVIPHPSSIWSVGSFSNGDFVTGCADGVVRIWTRSNERMADAQHITEYEKRAGEEIEKVRSGKAGQSEIAGKKYDAVIKVDLGDGVERRIGFNRGQNPYEVAQKFLWDHEIPQDYLDQVADFIDKNTRNIVIGQTSDSSSNYSDPFTGGGRYIPQASQSTAGSFSDPLTGGGRYVPSYSQPPAASLPQFPSATPAPSFTSAPSPAPSSSSSSSFQSFPQTAAVLFDQCNTQVIYNKLIEFNTKAGDSALNPAELQVIKKLTDSIALQPPKTGVVSAEDDAIFGKLLRWPVELRFPALDLLRVYLLHPDSAKKWSNNTLLVQTLIAGLEGENKVNSMLVFRSFVNMFKHPSFGDLLWNNQEQILEAVATCLSYAGDLKTLRLSLATLILNYSALLFQRPKQEGKMQCLSLLSELLGSEKDDETTFRGLVSLGTLIYNDEVTKALVDDFDLKSVIQAQLSSPTAKNSKVSTELKSFLKF